MEPVRVVPNSAAFLTSEDLQNPDIELIFVQHPPTIDAETVGNVIFNGASAGLDIVELPSGTPIYPTGFDGEGGLVLCREVDRYVVACQAPHEE